MRIAHNLVLLIQTTDKDRNSALEIIPTMRCDMVLPPFVINKANNCFILQGHFLADDIGKIMQNDLYLGYITENNKKNIICGLHGEKEIKYIEPNHEEHDVYLEIKIKFDKIVF